MKKCNSEYQIQITISRDEMNLVEFPFTLLSKRNENQKTIEFSDWIIINGITMKREWIVTGSDKHGLPTASDEELYIALMKISKDMGFQSRRVPIVRYQLAKLMGWGLDGKSYERIEQGLDRLSGVRIKAKNAFWDNEKKKYTTVNFGIIDDYCLYDETPSKKPKLAQGEIPISSFSWNEVLFNSFRTGNIKTIDAEFYFALKSPVTKRLYRFLDKKKYDGKTKFEIGIKKLASLLPLKDNYPSHIKIALEKAHDELIEKGFLISADYEKGKDREEKVIYRFPRKALNIDRTNELEIALPLQPERENTAILRKLEERGITKRVAQILSNNYPADQLQRQIEIFDWLKEKKSPLIGKNPAGFLRRSIEENYQPPEEYQIHAEKESRRREQEKIANQKQIDEEELERELARIRAYKEGLSHEERARLREEAESEVRSSGQYKKEFITEYLIQAKENELVARRLGIDLPE